MDTSKLKKKLKKKRRQESTSLGDLPHVRAALDDAHALVAEVDASRTSPPAGDSVAALFAQEAVADKRSAAWMKGRSSRDIKSQAVSKAIWNAAVAADKILRPAGVSPGKNGLNRILESAIHGGNPQLGK